MARVAQKWADQCVDVDYKDDYKRRDPILYHDLRDCCLENYY